MADQSSERVFLVVVDDSEFASRTLNNFLWVTFTRSDPANDIHGVDSFVDRKLHCGKTRVDVDRRGDLVGRHRKAAGCVDR